MTALSDFQQAVAAAADAANGDSNDAEISALWDAVDLACSLLDVDVEGIREEADR